MPMLIKHIDAIAREKQRDVLYVCFRPIESEDDFWPHVAWEDLPIREEIIDWLDAHKIQWLPCGGVANVNSMIAYQGQIYIDIPFDCNLPSYQELQSFLEHPDGSIRFPEVIFAYLPLESAMENAEHDEPGFWDRWAESF